MVKVVLPGPLTWLWLASADERFDRLHLLPPLLNVYAALLNELKNLGVEWVQIDEPILSLDLPEAWLNRYAVAYRTLAQADLPILLATYFGSVAEHAAMLRTLPIDGLHLDLARAPEQLETFLARLASRQGAVARRRRRPQHLARRSRRTTARNCVRHALHSATDLGLGLVLAAARAYDLAHEHALDPRTETVARVRDSRSSTRSVMLKRGVGR